VIPPAHAPLIQTPYIHTLEMTARTAAPNPPKYAATVGSLPKSSPDLVDVVTWGETAEDDVRAVKLNPGAVLDEDADGVDVALGFEEDEEQFKSHFAVGARREGACLLSSTEFGRISLESRAKRRTQKGHRKTSFCSEGARTNDLNPIPITRTIPHPPRGGRVLSSWRRGSRHWMK
jgi:hypothetical protein